MSGTFLITEYKPGKMRVVFDCSALYQDVSLNQQLLQGPVPRQRILESLEEGVLAVAAAMAKMDSSAKILTSGWHRNRLRWKFAKEPLETWSRGRNVSQRRWPDQESKSCYCHRFPRWLRQTPRNLLSISKGPFRKLFYCCQGIKLQTRESPPRSHNVKETITLIELVYKQRKTLTNERWMIY